MLSSAARRGFSPRGAREPLSDRRASETPAPPSLGEPFNAAARADHATCAAPPSSSGPGGVEARGAAAAVVDHVLHFEGGTALPYSGGYEAFVQQRQERRLTQLRAFDKQQKTIASEADYIARNIAGQNSKQAKGRRKKLERLPRLSAPIGEEGTKVGSAKAEQSFGCDFLPTVAPEKVDQTVRRCDICTHRMRGAAAVVLKVSAPLSG